MRVLVVALLTLAPLLLPTAAAAPSCASVTATPTLDAGQAYVLQTGASSAQVWAETNGVPGLQRVACQTPEGTTRPADTLAADTVPVMGLVRDLLRTCIPQVRVCIL